MGKIMIELSEEQWQILGRQPGIPLLVSDPVSGSREVLLRADDFDWVRTQFGEPDAPRQTDPRTGAAYAVLPEERYERFKAFFEEDPLTTPEKIALLREAGKRAGWHDPVWHSQEPS